MLTALSKRRTDIDCHVGSHISGNDSDNDSTSSIDSDPFLITSVKLVSIKRETFLSDSTNGIQHSLGALLRQLCS